MKLSVVIPVYNEFLTLEEIIERVRAVDIPKEIIVVDDYSTDGTRSLYEKIKDKVDLILLQPRNMGKGAAIREGLKRITGDYVVVQDADLEYNPQEYHILLEPLLQNKADVVYGSRFLGGHAHRVLYYWHSVGNRFLTLLSNMFTNLNLSDMETCYKMFRADVIRDITIEQNRFGFEPEITAKVAKKNVRIYEVGISYEGRTYTEGKKINWKDGFSAIWCIMKYSRGRYSDVGQDTLYRLESFPHYTKWIFSQIEKDLGEKILEVGTGRGAYGPFLTGQGNVVMSDAQGHYLDQLRKQYANSPGVEIMEYDLEGPPPEAIQERHFDTIVCLNVLEHIQKDEETLRHFYELLQSNGRLLLLVPAHPALYSGIDKELDHFRRYGREELLTKLVAAGFQVERLEYFNPLGAIGWYIAGRIFRAQRIGNSHVNIHRWLFPIARLLNRCKWLKFGLSHVAVARKMG